MEVDDVNAIRGQLHDLPRAQEVNLPGVGKQRRDVRGYEVLAIAEPAHQRAVLAGGHDPVRVMLAQQHHGVGAAHLLQGVPQSEARVALVGLFY